MVEEILERSIQSILDECAAILEDTRTLGAEGKWNDPLFSEDQEWVSNLDPEERRAAHLELADLERTRVAREDCIESMLIELAELVEGGGDEIIAQLKQDILADDINADTVTVRESDDPELEEFVSSWKRKVRDIQKLTQDTMGAEELPLKDMKDHIQSEYRRILLLARQNYTRLEETYNESRTLLRSLESLRSQALEEDRDLEEEREEA